MSLSTSAVGLALQARPVEILGTAIAVIVTGVWLLVAVRTLRALVAARSLPAK